MQSAKTLAEDIGIAKTCSLLGISRMTEYRTRRRSPSGAKKSVHPRALTAVEEAAVLDALSSEDFVDCAPASVYATLLENGRYLCSTSTMYRLLRKNNAVHERRQTRRHPTYEAPQLLAQKPNEVWSWDITKLPGLRKFEYYHLYVMLDIYSRRVIGWMVAERESGTLAGEFIRDCCAREGIPRGSLTIHSDRGTAMMSRPVVNLLSSLDVQKTVSRPQVSNDNPYSESHFKTMKYRPCFPKKFGSIQDVRAALEPFFLWYNSKHRHSGIAYLTPDAVHLGHAEKIQEQRKLVLAAAYAAAPHRFVRGAAKPPVLPSAAWINPPATKDEKSAIHRCTAQVTSTEALTHNSKVA